MKNIFKIIEYLPDTQQIVVRYARKNTHKNIDEYIESAVDLKELDLYDCESFSKSLMYSSVCSITGSIIKASLPSPLDSMYV